ncbi:MAG: hypothetical protein HY854_08320 [Burkholderiales bacterium]|nr:hypothetical protein [Burkholderiales bacterium]
MMQAAVARRGALESPIEPLNVAVWAAIGAAIGWAATQLTHKGDRIVFMENMAVAAFGSFAGGEFVTAMLRSGVRQPDITLLAIALAVVFSMLAVFMLGMMRRVVGPLRSGKPKRHR